MNEATRVRWQAGALLILIFVTGTITGGALVYAGIRVGREPMGRQPDGHQTVLRLHGDLGLPATYADLDLTDDQRRALERIIAESRPRTDSILREALPALRAETDSMRTRMRAVLTADQRRRLDQRAPGEDPMLVPPTMGGPTIIRGPVSPR